MESFHFVDVERSQDRPDNSHALFARISEERLSKHCRVRVQSNAGGSPQLLVGLHSPANISVFNGLPSHIVSHSIRLPNPRGLHCPSAGSTKIFRRYVSYVQSQWYLQASF